MRAAGRLASMLHTGTYPRRPGALSDDSMEEYEMDVPVAVPTIPGASTTPAAAAAPPVATNTIIATMLRAAPKISDLVRAVQLRLRLDLRGILKRRHTRN